MIKSNELRIGNYVYYQHPTTDLLVHKIEWLDFKEINEFPDIYNQYHKPIPITEELLLKKGFDKSNDLDKFYHLEILNEWTRIYFNPKHKLCTLSINQNDSCIKIQYLHELQNLVFSLTKKELDIQL